MDKADADVKEVSQDIRRRWVLLMLAVLLIWAGLGAAVYFQVWEDRGKFGDMFGAVNALFTGLAFAGVLMTIRLQMKEMSDTRGVLEKQQKQMELQAITLARQAEDANFFRLLEMFRHMAQNMQHPGGVPEEDSRIAGDNVVVLNANAPVGTEYWRFLAKVCRNEMRGLAVMLYGPDFTPEKTAEHWAVIYRRWNTSLGPYFSTLEELLDLLLEAEEITARRWARILRAQLGLQEMLPIYFHGLTPVGQQRLKPQIEKFRIFAHFSDDPAYHKLAPRHWYAPSAFLP